MILVASLADQVLEGLADLGILRSMRHRPIDSRDRRSTPGVYFRVAGLPADTEAVVAGVLLGDADDAGVRPCGATDVFVSVVRERSCLF